MDTKDIYEKLEFNAEAPFILHDLSFIQGQSLKRCNWHDSIEILYFTSGNGVVSYDLEKISASADEIVIVNSNVLHNIFATSNMHYYCLIIDKKFCVSNYIDTTAILFDKHINDQEIRDILKQFISEFYNYDLPCRPQLLRSSALKLLATLKTKHEVGSSESASLRTTAGEIRMSLNFIHAHYREKITLDEIAKASGLSKYYLAHEFRNHIGITVVEYINHVRCEQAKRMLQESKLSIADISVACGYPNPPYFTKTFLRNTGMRPKEYREFMHKMRHQSNNSD